MKILFLESFYGGSHKDIADSICKYSRYDITLKTLPARFWKWRMRGAALYFAGKIENPEEFDILLTTDLLGLADLKALWGSRCPPAIVYFHESQLSYPLSAGEQMDYQFGFTDITTCLAADKILFNSHTHMKAFFTELPGFIKKMPDCRPSWIAGEIREKASVLHPGCDFSFCVPPRKHEEKKSPVIVWNHRWEFDKNPEQFFRVLYSLDRGGCSFRLALLGENFNSVPKVFLEAKEYFGDRIIQYGYAEDKAEYFSLLQKSDMIISTSIQENFGLSVLEGIYAGCFPLLPNRLSYPELLPRRYHTQCLYETEEDLIRKASGLITSGDICLPEGLPDTISSFDWRIRIAVFDSIFEEFLSEHTGG